MDSNPRRTFMVSVIATGTLLGGTRFATAQGAVLSESDRQAAALRYKADTTKVDQAMFPKHDNTQMCSNCTLYQGKADAATGPCAIFPGKSVAQKGWCSAWVKKAG